MYLARNSNGCLWLFSTKPQRIITASGGYWHADGPKMPVSLKNVLTWRDSPLPVRFEADWIRESINLE